MGADTGQQSGDSGAPRNRARIHAELGGLYFQRGNMGVALEELRMAIAADPSYAPAYNVLGLVFMDLRENAQAQANFERAIRLSPNDADVNHNYALFLCQSGREADSARYFLAAVRNPLYSQPQKSYAAAGACAIKANNERDATQYLERERLLHGSIKLPINRQSLYGLRCESNVSWGTKWQKTALPHSFAGGFPARPNTKASLKDILSDR